MLVRCMGLGVLNGGLYNMLNNLHFLYNQTKENKTYSQERGNEKISQVEND